MDDPCSHLKFTSQSQVNNDSMNAQHGPDDPMDHQYTSPCTPAQGLSTEQVPPTNTLQANSGQPLVIKPNRKQNASTKAEAEYLLSAVFTHPGDEQIEALAKQFLGTPQGNFIEKLQKHLVEIRIRDDNHVRRAKNSLKNFSVNEREASENLVSEWTTSLVAQLQGYYRQQNANEKKETGDFDLQLFLTTSLGMLQDKLKGQKKIAAYGYNSRDEVASKKYMNECRKDPLKFYNLLAELVGIEIQTLDNPENPMAAPELTNTSPDVNDSSSSALATSSSSKKRKLSEKDVIVIDLEIESD